MHVINKPSESSFEKVGIRGKIFPTGHLSDDLEFVLIETETGHDTKTVEHVSTFVYYVLEGSGYFEVDGAKEDCTAGDLVVIPPGKAFIYKGKMKLLLTVSPVWREEQEETIG